MAVRAQPVTQRNVQRDNIKIAVARRPEIANALDAIQLAKHALAQEVVHVLAVKQANDI